MPDELLPTTQAAKVVGVNRRTLQDWVKAGLVTPTQRTAGGHARWDPEDLRRQVEEVAARRDTW
ncbi:hypothetical protein GCM10023201_40620 [Actinomycetospora corticicola]|uniref:DNA-binding transcriptional MerR regulator n=1 Tax=Actinomycetospora corticicola TaxID=663602 RepID=A0A7Y9DWT8_9PSEU|nr:DNA-binding transcriptional MerR regulator [Actinomycetospora corticicola]